MFAVAKPGWMRGPVVAVILLCGFVVIGSGEYTRELARKPFAIGRYIYSNDLRVAELASLHRWLRHQCQVDGPATTRPHRAGRQMFAMQCGVCHSVNGYRAMTPRVNGWGTEFATDVLQHLPLMRGTMPPFAGNEQDRAAVGAYTWLRLSPPGR